MRVKNSTWLLPLLLLGSASPSLCQDDAAYTTLNLGGVLSTWSTSCIDAMNTTITPCPSLLLESSILNYRLDSDELAALCTSDCKSALSSTRQTILQSCTAANDVIDLEGTFFSVSLVIDKYIYAYDVGCRQDASSGQYCDEIFYAWLNQTSLSSAQNCSDCNLGVAQVQLDSPFGYDDEFASEFGALTSSCSASNYPFTSPSAYPTADSGTATSTSSAATFTTTSCASTYVVESGDTCNSIAVAQNVSTYGVITAGNLDHGCTILEAGATLCLPDECEVYQVQYFDTCASIISSVTPNTIGSQFLAWNANINSLCGNVASLVGTYICVSPPGGTVPIPVISTPLAVSTASTSVAKPTNAPEQSNSDCAYWYTVQDGDTCYTIAQNRGISLSDFYFLNPEVNANCTNLDLGLAYCVQAVGNIATYSGYPTTSHFFSLTSLAYNTTTQTLPPTQPAAVTPISYSPTASGTLPSCTAYINYMDVPGIVDQSQSGTSQAITDTVNNCDFLAGTWDIDSDDFTMWNPSLQGISPCALQPGFSYCVLLNSTDQLPDPGPASDCLVVDSSDILNGTINSCSCFTAIDGYDNSTYLCDDVASDNNITVATLQSWNSWIGSDCDTGLYANMSYYDERAVCIGINSTALTSSAGVGPSGTPSASGLTSTITGAMTTQTITSSIGPTPSGTVSSCQQFYTVQSGDSCAAIEANFDITFAQFYSWNPEIGSNCQDLEVGYAYCVLAPSTSSTGSATTTSASPAPTRTGTAAGCSTYYTVQSGDGCQSIETMYNITFQQLYNWNTNIGDDCQSLWAGYALCVAGGPS